jgi:hypothetical protein
MRPLLALLVLMVGLTACSTTDQPEPAISASTVVQQDVDDFCQDVTDAITNDAAGDPEDQAERLEELQEAAQNLGVGVRDDMYAAEALTRCEEQLREAINQG